MIDLKKTGMFSLIESTLCYPTTDKLLAGISQILLLTV
jgi:hypothetical protein